MKRLIIVPLAVAAVLFGAVGLTSNDASAATVCETSLKYGTKCWQESTEVIIPSPAPPPQPTPIFVTQCETSLKYGTKCWQNWVGWAP